MGKANKKWLQSAKQTSLVDQDASILAEERNVACTTGPCSKLLIPWEMVSALSFSSVKKISQVMGKHRDTMIRDLRFQEENRTELDPSSFMDPLVYPILAILYERALNSLSINIFLS